MPLLTPDITSDNQMTLGQRGSMPQPQTTQDDSTLNFAAAVERRSNLAGTLYERYSSPKPDEAGTPGFDPEVSVPKGAEDHAQIFAGATGPQDIAWREQQYQREQADNRIIQQHGGWGLAATMATGLVDPVTLASMAVPVGGETRIASIARNAILAGGAAAAQEGAMQSLEVGRDDSPKSIALNIGGAVVAGGVLGGIFHSIPARTRESLADSIHEELHTDSTAEKALGPIGGRQSIVPNETNIPYEAPHPASARTPLKPLDEHPDTETVNNLAREEADKEGKVVSVQEGGKEVEGATESEQPTPQASRWSVNGKPIYEMSQEEMQSTSEAMRAEDVNTLTDIFGDKDVAAKYERLAASNSDRAYDASQKMYEAVSPEQQARLDKWEQGSGVQSLTAADVREYARTTGHISDESEQSLAESLKNALTEVGDKTNPEEMNPKEMQAYLQLRRGFEIAKENGWDSQKISETAIRSAARRFSDPVDAEYMLKRFLKDTEEGRVPTPKESKLEAPKAPEPPKLEAPALPDVPQSISEAFKPATSEELAAHTKQAQMSMAERLKATAAKPEAEIPESIEEHINPSAESTAGAAAVTPDMRGEEIARGAQTLAGTLGKVSPGARAMTSPSLEVRKLTQELVNLPEMMSKNYEGIATASPIERELWKYDGVHHQGMQARSEQYKIYRERMAGQNKEPMVRGEFNQEISKAMRRGDIHAVPEVAAAAKKTRSIEFDPLKERAMKNGSLPEGVKAKGADSYLMRQYDAQKIKNNMTDFLDRLKRGFVAQGVDTAEAGDIAHKAMRNIMGSERGTMDWKVMDEIVPKSGRLKERTLDLPDTLLEPYLNNDIDHVAHSYLRSMAPEVEMTDRFGSRDMKDQIGQIHDDYARMIERAGSDGEKAKLSDRMAADLRDVTAMRDRLYGIYGQPKDPGHFAVRAGRMLRTVNALRLLGAATLAHFPDLANVMMRYGLGNTFAAIGKVLTNPEAISLTRSEAKRMGAGLDMAMNATASMLGDYATHSQYAEQRVGQYLARKFSITTGETPLITAVQQLTSTMAQDTIVRNAQRLARGQTVSDNQMAKFAAAGLDKDMMLRIADQHEKFGAKVNGLNFGMSDQWKDAEAASKFESAILRDAHSVTLRPGVGDTPLFMSTEWGKALRQFTTFGYAAQRSVVNPLMQGLAHGDPRAAQAIFALAAMGTLSYVSKQTAAQQPIEDPSSARFALEVLDKSNLMGWTSDVIFPALWMLGQKSLSRWSDRDPVETLGGPVLGTVASTYAKQLPGKALADAGLADEDQKGLSRSDLHFMRRLMPGQNLWYARGAINQLEDAVADGFDLPGKSNADRAAELASNQQ